MFKNKSNDTPIEARKKEGDDEPIKKDRYQRLVSKLIYISHTRPDIVFAISMVSQYMHPSKEIHQDLVYRILKHLKNSLGK